MLRFSSKASLLSRTFHLKNGTRRGGCSDEGRVEVCVQAGKGWQEEKAVYI